MAKTLFSDGNPLQGILGTIVNAAWLNKVFSHRHDGLDQDGSAPLDYAVDQGAANVYVVALTPALAAHIEGLPIHFKAANANTGASTLTVNGMAVKAIKQVDGSDLPAGAIVAGQMVTVIYTGAVYMMVSKSVSQFSSGIQGVFKNMQLSATGTNATVNVSYDALQLSDGSNYMTDLNGVGTINTTLSGVGGLDTGALAASTWYSVWRIAKIDGTKSWLISLSATVPTMPDGYVLKARVGWIRTDSTVNKYPLAFTQFGKKIQYKVNTGSNVTNFPIMASGTPTFPVAVGVTSYIPVTAGIIKIALFCGGNGTNNGAVVASPNQTTNWIYNNPSMVEASVGNYTASTGSAELMLESNNIYWGIQAGSSPGTSSISVVGWEDNI